MPEPSRVQPVPAVMADRASQSDTAMKPWPPVACAVYVWAMLDADADPDLPCAPIGVDVSWPVMTATRKAASRNPELAWFVTVTVIAAPAPVAIQQAA